MTREQRMLGDPRDVTSYSVGALTAGVGSMSLVQVQTILGIIATAAGLVLTVATFVWRRREHHHKMKSRRQSDETGR